MQGSVFDYYASRNTSFLHGCGAGGTEHLLSTFEFVGNERVLEVGFGTGSTLVLLRKRLPNLDLYGLERSSIMLKKAKSRLKFVRQPTNHLFLLGEGNVFPFFNHKFDVVYLESVLSILKLEEINQIVKEIFRVLKPNGIFAVNETIWLPNLSEQEIKTINDICFEKFGVIQANQHLNTVEKWKSLFERNQFIIEICEPTRQLQRKSPWNLIELMSRAFSIYGRFLSTCNPGHFKMRRLIKQAGTALQTHGMSCLQSYIFTMRKNFDSHT